MGKSFEHGTNVGRIVYNRKIHRFSCKDLQRITNKIRESRDPLSEIRNNFECWANFLSVIFEFYSWLLNESYDSLKWFRIGLIISDNAEKLTGTYKERFGEDEEFGGFGGGDFGGGGAIR